VELGLPKIKDKAPYEPSEWTVRWLLDRGAQTDLTSEREQRWDTYDDMIVALLPTGQEHRWEDDAPEYISNSEAVTRLADNRLPLSQLSKMLTPHGPIRYMRKGQRCKVHIGDFMRYAKVQGWTKSAEADEENEGYIADIEERKAEARRKRKTAEE
jgi:hypothetical protein